MDLRGASVAALAALTERLHDLIGTRQESEELAGQLFTLSQLFRSEAGLRRFATDPSLPLEARSGMVEDVFRDKLEGPALTLLTEAAGRRWTRSRDLPDVLERLSEIAAVRSAASRSGEVTDELFELGRLVDGNAELRDALSDPGRSVDDKSALLDALLDGKVLPATLTLAKQALAGTYHTMSAALTTYRTIAAESQGEVVATVRVARPLAAADERRLTEVLGRQYAATVHLNVVIDPEVLGGVRVEIGDQVIDGTISTRMDEARRRLVG
ncbi:MAG: F0F1 ATP synthase subunit delta [Nocardioides sp.]